MSTNNTDLNSLRTQNRKALDQLNQERAERQAWNEANADLFTDNNIVHRSAASAPDICYRVNEDALVEPEVEPEAFSDLQIDSIGEALGMVMVQMRTESLARERAILGRINLLEQELRALQSDAPKAKRGPTLVKDEDSAA
jgi:hypothetical protein